MTTPLPLDGAGGPMQPDAPETFTAAVTEHRASARLVEYALGRQIALPPHVTLEAVEDPSFVPVPGAPYYAYGLMPWQNHWLPFISLQTLLAGFADGGLSRKPRHALIVAYQRAPGQTPVHGAIAAHVLSETILVGNEDACDLPTDSDLWPLIALSCFRHQGTPTPILNTGRLFGQHFD